MRTLRRIVIAALLAGVLTGVAACGDDDEPPAPEACGMVGFTPQTDDGVFDIQATGVDCATAKRVAVATRARRYGDPPAFTAEGFSCTGTRVPSDGLQGVDWRCERDGALITFTRN